MGLYLAALREARELGRVKAWIWCDTRCNPANILTKLKVDGCLEFDDVIRDLYRKAMWEPTHPFGWDCLQLSDPIQIVFKDLPPPLPPTKKMQLKKTETTDPDHYNPSETQNPETEGDIKTEGSVNLDNTSKRGNPVHQRGQSLPLRGQT